jgi:hypothetical protein
MPLHYFFRVLCGIVKNLVSKVGAASEESSSPGQPDELSEKVRGLS